MGLILTIGHPVPDEQDRNDWFSKDAPIYVKCLMPVNISHEQNFDYAYDDLNQKSIKRLNLMTNYMQDAEFSTAYRNKLSIGLSTLPAEKEPKLVQKYSKFLNAINYQNMERVIDTRLYPNIYASTLYLNRFKEMKHIFGAKTYKVLTNAQQAAAKQSKLKATTSKSTLQQCKEHNAAAQSNSNSTLEASEIVDMISSNAETNTIKQQKQIKLKDVAKQTMQFKQQDMSVNEKAAQEDFKLFENVNIFDASQIIDQFKRKLIDEFKLKPNELKQNIVQNMMNTQKLQEDLMIQLADQMNGKRAVEQTVVKKQKNYQKAFNDMQKSETTSTSESTQEEIEANTPKILIDGNSKHMQHIDQKDEILPTESIQAVTETSTSLMAINDNNKPVQHIDAEIVDAQNSLNNRKDMQNEETLTAAAIQSVNDVDTVIIAKDGTNDLQKLKNEVKELITVVEDTNTCNKTNDDDTFNVTTGQHIDRHSM